MEIETILTIILPPITAVVGWVAGTRKRKNDALGYMQATIDELVEKNAEYVKEITALRAEVAKWQTTANKLQRGQDEMQSKLEEIKKENANLLKRFESAKPKSRKGAKDDTK